MLSFTVITSKVPSTLTKTYSLKDGSLVLETVANLNQGHTEIRQVASMTGFANVLESLTPAQALCYGVPAQQQMQLVSKSKFKTLGEPEGITARTKENFSWPGGGGVLMLDFDPAKDCIAHTKEELIDELESVVPGLAAAGKVWCCSSSSYIYNNDTGEELKGLRGQRIYIHVADASDIKRAGDALSDRLWLAGHGYFLVGEAGQLLERCLFDTSVWQPTRLDFAAGANCIAPLQQRRGKPEVFEGKPLDTKTALADLDKMASATVAQLKRDARQKVKPEAQRKQKTAIETKAASIAGSNAHKGQLHRARRTAKRAIESNILTADYQIILEGGETVTVHELLKYKDKYNHLQTLDPIEPSYLGGKVVGILYLDGRTPCLHSFAHGSTTYRLVSDISKEADKLAESIEYQLIQRLEIAADDDETIKSLEVDVIAIDKMIRGSFWAGTNSKLNILTPEESMAQFTEKDAFKMLQHAFGRAASKDQIIELGEKLPLHGTESAVRKQINAIAAIPSTAIIDYLKYNTQRLAVEWRVDMFATSCGLQLLEDKARIVLTHKPFPSPGKYSLRIINDYKEHFPNFDELLEFIVMSRFALDRKKAYLWILADSDWGKGLLMGVFKKMEMALETSMKEVETIMEGKPVGKSPLDFKRAFILWVDEFKTVKSELKQLQSEISLSPKHQLMCNVELFAKIFTSAESVASLVGESGVEDQFANRMSLFKGAGSIVDRPVYREVGNPTYFRSMHAYAVEYINKRVEAMRKNKPEEAQTIAERWLDAFISRHGLGVHHKRLSESLPDIAASFIEWAKHTARENFTEKHLGVTYITKPKKAYENFLEDTFSHSERFTLLKKSDEVLTLCSADGKGAWSQRIGKPKPVHSVRLTESVI